MKRIPDGQYTTLPNPAITIGLKCDGCCRVAALFSSALGYWFMSALVYQVEVVLTLNLQMHANMQTGSCGTQAIEYVLGLDGEHRSFISIASVSKPSRSVILVDRDQLQN